MSEKTQGGSNQITTPLLLIFLVLKLTNNIDWSWWWVMSPLWIPFVISIVFAVLASIVNDTKSRS